MTVQVFWDMVMCGFVTGMNTAEHLATSIFKVLASPPETTEPIDQTTLSIPQKIKT
jgi:hypothetical protein